MRRPADILQVIESLPEGSLACDIVTGALVVYDHSPIEAVGMLARHIGYVHVTDAVTGGFRGRGRAVILGTGQVDLVGVLASLEEHGYHEWIGLEPVDDHGRARGIGSRHQLFTRALKSKHDAESTRRTDS